MELAERYLAQMKALLPQGAAWSRESGTVMESLLAGLAQELARTHVAAEQLIEEADPRTTSQLLPEWERAYGLPDGCVVADPTEDGRRLAVHQKVASLGGQSAPYFIRVAALLGYDAEVENFRPSRLPFTLPQMILGRPWAFAWQVAVYGPVVTDTPSYASADLECVISRASPAHTVVTFDWDPEAPSSFHFDFTDA